MDSINNLITQIPPLLLALTLHEYAHGYVAYHLGDPTAKNAGRLTLNPLSHLDPIGTIVFVFAHIGWAKPVPVNPIYFRDPRGGMLWVALAGPLTNLLLAITCAVLLKLIIFMAPVLPQSATLTAILTPIVLMLNAGVWINVVLFIFNFLPIPPLDGSRIMAGLLPEHLARGFDSFERYGMIVVLLLFATGALSYIINPIIRFTSGLLL